ncbi:MAG: hypothetical protein A2X59_11085 [Nitrospirae bacterium GWC2_42_7]|nr:MAG: hypothetical protein A2X59_11085 [Nitrospirae bacterium GWC2_42_7]
MENNKYAILLIDPDHEKYIKSLTELLKGCSIHITIKTNPEDACGYFYHNKTDLVLLNHTKGYDSLEIIKFLKSVRPIMPVIIMTNCGSEDLAVSVFRSGARDYFKKPFAIDEFCKSIKKTLGIREGHNKINSPQYISGFERVIMHIHENYNSNIMLSDAAKLAGMSTSSFGRAFKKETGITFVKYLNNIRIAKAMDLLKEEGLSMNDIAYTCGFSNQFHFTRTFRKITNKSPLTFKRTLSKHLINNSE